ncbi:uncharacterized protein LOC105446274 [Strongylocentrotus purpuratus]|uniref:Uncharacterized protein n=1 Tax=Strongylocentrotus purpuratus TaxID=7668 RepID=A0A7M7HPN1_STRPU|nr:uncharacterized protein LOC105446274 [Strongylocentrotus purpuratus]
MALEQPFTHWPFSSASNGRPGQQNSQRNLDRFKRYDTNNSPFMEISPIPTGREFGTFPRNDRQPKNVARKEVTQNLNHRASRGFLSPEELTPENQFLPILPENEERTRDYPLHEPAFQQDIHQHQGIHQHQVHPDRDTTREPSRGLSLMDRYRDTSSFRRTNSLLEFEQFIGQVGEVPTNQREQNPPHQVPSPQQRQRQQPAMTEQQAFKRLGLIPQQQQQQAYPVQNGGSRRQPNGGLIGVQQYSSGRRQANGGPNVNQRNGLTHPNGIQQPRVVPTLIPSYPTTAKPIHRNPPRKPKQRREKGKERKNLCCGIGLVLAGFVVMSGFVAAFIAITVLNDAWPNSGLLLAGVVFGLLLIIVGFIFACHRCYSMEEYDDTPAPVVGDVHPVWQQSLQRSTLDRPANLEAIPMTDLPLVGGDYNEQPLEPDVHVIDGNLGETLPMNADPSPVANGVPTPLAFATPFSTSLNDYGMY